MWKELLYYYSDESIWNVCPNDIFLYRNIIILKCYLVTRWLLTHSMTVAPYLRFASSFWMVQFRFFFCTGRQTCNPLNAPRWIMRKEVWRLEMEHAHTCLTPNVGIMFVQQA
ncbi:hypothetical protein CEXT_141231 [Caerostris extrusa]|uniref:Uncharacterized protein n=1 Tax=Caerostris extrusa TaxID=172846 RepID=A0AAV4W950_CAEEX|nr:hypothetical protein CEXT_141231 [Caerostris extrusa]